MSYPADRKPFLGLGPLVLAALALLVGASLPSARAIVIRDDVADSLYTAAGQNEAFDPVVELLVHHSSGSTVRNSGVLIDGSWVLTAAHSVAGSNITGITLIWDTSSGLNSVTWTAAEWFTHPNWTGDLWAGYDLGLIRLDSPVTSITPATLYEPSDGSELGRTGYLVGYGLTGTGSTGALSGTGGVKRAATNKIDLFGNDTSNDPHPAGISQRIMLADFDSSSGSDNASGSPMPTSLEGIVATGDSGGGTFVEVDGVWKLAGIHSFIASVSGTPTSGYGDLAGITRVSQFSDWIIITIPEPGTLMLLALGSAMLAYRGGKQRVLSRKRG